MILTGTLLEFSRTHPQSTELYLSIFQPQILFTALVSGSVDTDAIEIPYRAATGSYLNIADGMTLLVGTSAGGEELGRTRIRSATSSYLKVAENSNIQWPIATNLTVLNYYELWPIYPNIVLNEGTTDVTFYKDWDIQYSNQNSILGAYANAGNHKAVFAPGTVYWQDNGSSHVITGTTLSYWWDFPGGNPTGSVFANPGGVTYTTPGHYVTRLSISGSNGSGDVSYRYISVYNRPETHNNNIPIKKWTLNDLSGGRNEGGYTASITIMDENCPTIHEGDVVVLFTENYYGYTQIDFGGNNPNNAKIFFTGHILRDSIQYNYKNSSVTFEVGSVTLAMKAMEGFAISVESKVSPTKWFELFEMDSKKALYHYLRWHSTVLKLADFEFKGQDRPIQYFDTGRESLFDSIDNYMRDALYGQVVADRQGKIWAEIGAEFYQNPIASFPPIQEITKRDWIGTPNIEETGYEPLSLLECGGIQYAGAASGSFGAYLSNAPSETPYYRGTPENIPGLAITGQRELNQICGNIWASKNTQFPKIDLDMSGFMNQFDIAPQEAVAINITASDTNRGIPVSGSYLIDNMSWTYETKNKTMMPSIGFQALVSGSAGETVIIPIEGDNGWTPPPVGGINITPPIIGGTSGTWGNPPTVAILSCLTFPGNSQTYPLSWDTGVIRGDGDLNAIAYLPCVLRAATTSNNASTIAIHGKFWGDARTNFAVYGVVGGNRVIGAQVSVTATPGGGYTNGYEYYLNGYARFFPLSPMYVDGFEIVLNSGLGSLTKVVKVNSIAAGTVQATNETGITVNTTAGNYYGVEGTGGSWSNGVVSGKVELIGQVGGTSLNILEIENTTTGFTIFYHQATDNYFNVRMNDVPGTFGDNTGEMSWVVSLATLEGRKIELSPSTIHNICPPTEI